MRRRRFEWLLLAGAISTGVALAVDNHITAAAFPALRPGNALPAGRTIKHSPNIKIHTRYSPVEDGGRTVLRADSAAGAAGISRALDVNPTEFPWLRWRWKVGNLIVAKSGPARFGQRAAMERNIARDFRAAFGEAAPPVNGIVIATDSDNTGAKATAFYGDIFFYKQLVINNMSGADRNPPRIYIAF